MDPFKIPETPEDQEQNPFVIPQENMSLQADPFKIPEEPEETSKFGDVKRGLNRTIAGFNLTQAKDASEDVVIYDRIASGEDPRAIWKEEKAKRPNATRVPHWIGMDAEEAADYSKERKQAFVGDWNEAQEALKIVKENPPTEQYQALVDTKNWEDLYDTVTLDAIASGLAESLGGQLPTMPLMLLGVAGPMAMAAGQMASAFGTEVAATPLEVLSELGVDPSNTEEVIRTMHSAQFNQIMAAKLPKSAVIALFEGAGGFIAGKTISKSKVGNILAQVGAGSTVGGTGEAVGSVAIDEKVQPGAVALEVLGSGVGQVAESAMTKGDPDSKVQKADESLDLTGLQEEIEAKAEVEQAQAVEDAVEPLKPSDDGIPVLDEVIDDPGIPKLTEVVQADQLDPDPIIVSSDLIDAKEIENQALSQGDEIADAMHKDIINSQVLSWMGNVEESGQYSQQIKAATKSLKLQPTKVTPLLAGLQENAPTAQYGAIAKRVTLAIDSLQKAGQDFNVRIIKNTQAVNEGWAVNEKARFITEGDKNLIEYRSSGDALSNGLNFKVILHELVHAATASQIRAYQNNPQMKVDNPSLAQNVEDLTTIIADLKKKAEDTWKSGGFVPQVIDEWFNKGNNSLDNEFEVLAWGLTDPEFQQWMRSTAFSGKPQSFAERMFIALKNLFGIARSDQSTFAHMLGVFTDLTKAERIDEINKAIKTGSDFDTVLSMKETNPPISAQVLASVRHTYEQEQIFLSKMAGLDSTFNPYQEGFSYLSTLAKEKNVPMTNVSNEGVFLDAMEKGTPADVQPSDKLGPYTFFPREGMGLVAVAIDKPDLFTKLKDQYPNYEIMTMPEAEYYVRTGKTGTEAFKTWRKKVESQDMIDRLGKVSGTMRKAAKDKLGDLSEFMNIEDPQVAKKELLENGKDLKQNYTDAFSAGAGTKALLTDNAAIKWLRTVLRKGIRASQDMNQSMVAPIVKSYHDMTPNQQIAVMQALLIADKNMIDMDPAMMKRAGFDDKMIDMIQKFYEADRYLHNKNNQNRVRLGMKPIERRAGHFPGIFNDQYQAAAYVNGEIVGIVGASTRIGLEQHKKIYSKKNGNKVKYTDYTRKSLTQGYDERMPLGQFYDNLDKIIGPDNGSITKAQEAAQDAAAIMAQQFLGFNRFDKSKKGIEGNIGNKAWKSAEANAQEQFLGMVQYLQDGAYHHEMMPHIKDLSDLASDPEIVRKRPRTAKYLSAQLHFLTNRSPRTGLSHGFMNGVNKAGELGDMMMDGVLKTLGLPRSVLTKGGAQVREAFALTAMSIGNVAFMGLQFSQVPISGIPFAAQIRKAVGAGFTESRTAPIKALAQTVKMYGMTRKEDFHTSETFKRMNPEEKMVVQFAVDNNLMDFGTLEQQHKQIDTASGNSKIINALDFSRKFPEQTTRPYVFYWMYNILKDNGVDQKHAMEVAMNATQNAMIDYHQSNRAMVYSGLGQMGAQLGQLKTFMHGFVSQQIYFAQNPKALSAFLATYVMFAGVEGLLGFEEGNELVRQFNAVWNDEPEKDLKYYTNQILPDVLKYGLITHATGYDLYSRVRMPMILSTDTLIPANLNWMWQNGVTAEDWLTDFENQRKKKNFVRQISPSSIRSAFIEEWARMDKEGNLRDKNGDLVFKNYEYGTGRKLGLRRPEETEAWESYNRRRETKERRQEKMKEISNQVAEWISDGRSWDNPKLQELVQEYVDMGGQVKQLLGSSKIKQVIQNRESTLEQRGRGLVGKGTKADASLNRLFEITGR